MQENDNFKKSGLSVLIVSSVFGLLAGVVGYLFSESYFSGYLYNMPMMSSVDLTRDGLGGYKGAGLIIRDPKKVVVEQEDKINETLNSAKESLVGIFDKKQTASSSPLTQNGLVYQLNENIAQGLILTTDGWVVISGNQVTEDSKVKYTAIDKSGRNYEIDSVFKDKFLDLTYAHLKGAKDLPVRKMAGKDEIKNISYSLIINWRGLVRPVYSLGTKKGVMVEDSDFSDRELVLSEKVTSDFFNSFIYGLDGSVEGVVDGSGKAKPVFYISSSLKGILSKKSVSRPSLGVYYTSLSNFAGDNEIKKGALIQNNIDGLAFKKGSPAELAKLKKGDIIVSVDNVEIDENNDLSEIIEAYSSGDKIALVYFRGGKNEEMEIVLSELK